jgi:hypothetical protein
MVFGATHWFQTAKKNLPLLVTDSETESARTPDRAMQRVGLPASSKSFKISLHALNLNKLAIHQTSHS